MFDHQICLILILIANAVIGAPRRDFQTKTNSSSRWSDAARTIQLRLFHKATSLPKGKLLITGGTGYDICATTEFYYPSEGKWTAGTSMNDCRWYHTSSLLKDGKVLVAGGYVEDSEDNKKGRIILDGAELFDPTTGGWTRASSLHQPRHSHTGAILPNGKVLVIGGLNDMLLNSTELYDPSTGNWSIMGNMHWRRVWHTATTLANGNVLVTGGWSDIHSVLSSAELYDPLTGKWKIVNAMTYSRMGHTATVLMNGKVLVVGGQNRDEDAIYSTELFDPSTETWTLSGKMHSRRAEHTASLLKDGRVLVTGGGIGGDDIPGFNPVNTSEIYDPSTGIWTTTNNMHYTRAWHTASVLDNGNVLVVGGSLDNIISAYTPELYDASTSTYVLLDEYQQTVSAQQKGNDRLKSK